MFQKTSSSSVIPDSLKLVSYRRQFPSSTSSESVLSVPTPDGDASLSYSHELVQEAIYALTGKSGKYLKKDVTGEFKLDIKARNLDTQEALKLLKLSEIGRLHNEIKKYGDSNSEFFLCGLFGQGLISQLENELVQFYGLVAHLQDNVSFLLNFCRDFSCETLIQFYFSFILNERFLTQKMMKKSSR